MQSMWVFLLLPTVAWSQDSLYFPPPDGEWETVRPQDVGWKAEQLELALKFAGDNQSSGVVVLHRGKILAEQYFPPGDSRQRKLGTDAAGGPIEDVASVQKSIASVLIGIAHQKGLLKVTDSVSGHLGAGWSRAEAGEEQKITIRHLLTMTSGLDSSLQFEAEAGTKWRYNTPAYAKTMLIVETVSRLKRNEVTAKWLTHRLGMQHSKWVPRNRPELEAVNPYGFATSPRDLARFGLMMFASGEWNQEPILSDAEFLHDATHASQKLNPNYGYFWWLNRARSGPQNTRRLPAAPADTVVANGALNRRCFVVPSWELVVTRLGGAPQAGRSFDRRFWRLLAEAAPD